jgi:hypothetical protein
MAEIEVREMIAAFSVGCMDRKNYVQFKEHINSGGSLPAGQLGELQNVVSLIPSILEIENPRPELKNKLAKNLLSIHREKNKVEDKPEEEEKKITEERKTKEKTGSTLTMGTRSGTMDEIDDFEESISRDTYSAPGLSLLTKGTLIPFVILVLLLVVTVVILFSMKDNYDTEIEKLNSDIESINTSLTTASRFVAQNRHLVEFLNKKDLILLDLYDTSDPSMGPSKMFLALSDREALIEVKNLPQLELNEAFQIWAFTRRNSVSLGLITKVNDANFVILSDIGVQSKNLIDSIKVTLEPRIGSEIPGGNVLLRGSIK